MFADTGDLYVWGWNEGGQLGLPNGKDIDSRPADNEDSLDNRKSSKLGPKTKQFRSDDNVTSGGSKSLVSSTPNVKDIDSERFTVNTNAKTDNESAGTVKRSIDAKADSGTIGTLNTDWLKDIEELHQDIDAAQIQPVPFGLDIPDDFIVKEVSCGSRHTCLLFGRFIVSLNGPQFYYIFLFSKRTKR